ncbi:MAG: rhomboid family intramembrane serine protease [Arachidicoccus sp.]|nr:rhomboid family intramembrane serine protease [Arachidicoccus sp.]
MKKLQKVILPFIIITVLFVICFTFLNWFLIIRNKMFDVSQRFVATDLAFVFAWIPILIWLRKYIAKLHIPKVNNYYFLFFWQLLAAVLMMFCAKYSQQLLLIKLHGYKAVTYPQESDKYENTDYFFIQKYFLDTAVHPAFRTVVQDNVSADSADLTICICSPMYKNSNDTVNHLADYWLAVQYVKKVSSNISEESVPFLLKDYDKECEKLFQKEIRSGIGFYERIDNKSYLSEALDDAADKAHLDVTGSDRIFFIPHAESYRSTVAVAQVKIAYIFFASVIIWILAVAFVSFKENITENNPESDYLPYPERKNYVARFFEFIYIKENYVATPWILYLNSFMFVAVLFSFTGFFSFPVYILYNYGGNLGFVTINGHQYWRLFTYGFIHQGLFHFVSNMFFLVIIGKSLEAMIGKTKMILLYGAALIFSGMVSAYHNWNSVAVGASGAIMGLFSAFYVLVLTKSTQQKISALFIWALGIYIIINFSLGFTVKGIDNAAHIGGLIAGIIIGTIYLPFVRKKNKQPKNNEQNAFIKDILPQQESNLNHAAHGTENTDSIY